MARVRPLDREEFAPELRALTEHLTDFELGHLKVFAHRPEVALAWLGFVGALRKTGTLDRRLIEIVRLRVAFHNQCRRCMASRFGAEPLDDDLVCSLEQPEELPDLSEAERAALRLADLLATDHLAITDAHFDDLRQHFDESEIVELCLNIGTYVGIGRLGAVWRLTDDLPERYAEDGQVHFAHDGIHIPDYTRQQGALASS